jgi:hypothetical protein
MVKMSLGNSGRFLSEEWHRKRKEARESFGIFEFGETEIVRYDLDNIVFDRVMRDPVSDPAVQGEGAAKGGHPLHRPAYLK